jgi:hypothetical protein
MFTKTQLVIALTAAIGIGAATASFAREAGEGPRGEGKGHPVIQTKDVLAREAGEGRRGEGKGHPVIQTKDILAREAGEGPRGEGKGHPKSDTTETVA